jgi:phytanoyl-CoA hydroxylase
MSHEPLPGNRFHSRFGGMWVDRSDFQNQLARRIADGEVSPGMASDIRDFERDGYVIFEGAAPDDDLTRFETAISTAFRNGHENLIGQLPGSGANQPVVAGMTRKGTRIVDSFAVLPSALDLLANARLTQFMRAIFDEQPLLFQSISFDMGSGQGMHRDTAYVVVNRPMEMLACWIALEDVRPGSGELQYIAGSHRLPDFQFSDNRKHWNSQQDGMEAHNKWFRWILDESDRRQLPTRRFMAKRGDILVWHADLAHGGSPITDPELTRKSLVGHYCPVSAEPYFMVVSPNRRTKREYRGISYASWHYDLAAS